MKIISLIFGSVGMKRTTNPTSVIERFSLGDLYEKSYHKSTPLNYLIYKSQSCQKLQAFLSVPRRIIGDLNYLFAFNVDIHDGV